MNILIVDDDRSIRLLLERMVIKYQGGANVLLCPTAAEAIKVIERTKIDGAFLDLVLPDLPGLAIAEECSKKQIPVVFCTSTRDIHNLGLMFQFGWVIDKPILAEAVERSLKYFRRYP